MRGEERRLAAAIGALVLLTVLTYSRTFDVPWYFDDIPNLVENPLIRDLTYFFDGSAADGAGASSGQLYSLRARWLAFLTFAFDFYRAGYSLAAFHTTNLALHCLAAVVVLLLLRRLLAGRLGLALFGASIFALHPLQTAAVTYIVQRVAVLAGLLCLAAVVLYLRARDALVPGTGGRWRRFAGVYMAALACGAAACFAKQNAVVLPGLVGLVEALHPKAVGAWSRGRRALLVLPFTLVPLWISLPAARKVVTAPESAAVASVETDVVGETVSPLANLATQSEVIWRYLRRVVLPYGQVFDLGLTVEPSPWRVPAIAAGLGLIALVGTTVALRRRAPLVALGVLWFFGALAAESSVYVLDPYFEHRLYLPMAGVAMVVAAGIARLPVASPRRITAIGLTAVAVLALLTVRRNEQWRDPAELWRADLAAGSMSYRSAIGLADTLYRRGEVDRAENLYRSFVQTAFVRCTEGRCGDRYLLNAGVAAERIGEPRQALGFYRRALERSPDYAPAHYNLGVLLHREGKEREALAAFERAAELAPADADAVFNRAMVALELGDPRPAQSAVDDLRGVHPEMAEELQRELEAHSHVEDD